MNPVSQVQSHQSEHKRGVNELIHQSLHDQMGDEPIAYFCECPSLQCFNSVALSATEYETGRRNPRWSVRSPSH